LKYFTMQALVIECLWIGRLCFLEL